MACKKCNSDRVVSVGGKCSDLSNVCLHEAEIDGYLPDDMGIGGGDYIEFDFCLDCGQIAGDFPVKKTEIERKLEEIVAEQAEKAEHDRNFDPDKFFE